MYEFLRQQQAMDDELEPPFFRSGFNYDREAASLASSLECLDASRTKQSFAEEADINTIVRRFGITGQLPTNVRAPTFDDFTGVMDFHSAMNAVAAARESFDKMPADIRARFGNSPQAFVEFCSDEANREEGRKLGLLMPGPQELVAPAPPADPPAPEPGT